MIPSGAQKGRHITRWTTGLVTNRAATSMPFRRSYGALIQYYDALFGGLNVEISPQNTLVRRPGWTAINSVGYSGTAQSFYAAVLNGTQYNFLATSTNVYQFATGVMNSLYTKGTTAQTFFQQVGNVLYISDGNTNQKLWTETNGGFTLQNNGIAAPANAPTINNLNLYDTVGATQTTHAWVANYTYVGGASGPNQYYFEAPTGEIFWSVVPQGATMTSGATAPNWASVFGQFGGTIVDGQMVWVNCGTIGTWAANTAFANASYLATHPQNQVSQQATITTGGVSGNFNWQAASTSAEGFTNSSPLTGNTNTLFIKALGLNIPAGAVIQGIQVQVYRGANRINAVSDVTVQLLKAGVAAGSNKAAGGFWPQILWNAYNIPLAFGLPITYGGPTDLWGAAWTPADINNAGFGIQLVANQASTRTTSASITFINESINQPVLVTVYYGAGTSLSGSVYAKIIIDSNGNLQRVKVAGTSGGSAPTWSTTIGGTTVDGGITWECLGTGNTLSALFGWNYAYGYHSSGPTNHLSTMSPQLTVNAPIIGTGVQISGVGSSDTQVDRADLYRTADGGAFLLYDQSTTNVANTTWTINDSTQDASLNFLLVGPVAHANDPPPTGGTVLAYYQGRMWMVVGNLLYFSAGPDCTNGDGNQAWPPANVFAFANPITSIKPTSQGLVVVDQKNLSVVLGGPQTLTFWVKPLLQDFGALSPNAVTQQGDEIVMYTSQQQLFAFSPTGQNEVGFNVADTLASTFAASSTYLAIHRSGQDQGLFICDGATNSQRFNMNTEAWDTLATPSIGLGPIASISLSSTSIRALVTAVGGVIYKRDPLSFSDGGAAYAANAVVGSVVLSESGEDPATVESVFLTSAAVGTALSVAVLPNEISGSFTSLINPVNEPPQLPASSTINMQRWDWKTNTAAKAQLVKHLQVKITMPATDTVKNEVYTLSVK